MPQIEQYDRVRLTTDRFEAEGAKRGMIGYIIEVYADAYEVELSGRDGVTLAQIVASDSDLEKDATPDEDRSPG